MEQPLLDAVSDWVIAVSYFAIPLELLYAYKGLQRHRRGYMLSVVAALFVLFITLCGMTHAFNAMHMAQANHVAKAATAVVSFVTAVLLAKLIPVMVSMPGQLAALSNDVAYESNMRVFNQTLLLCTKHLRNETLIPLANETLKYMFPASRIAVVRRGVQLRHGLHEVAVDMEYVLLVEDDLYDKNMGFFEDLAQQLAEHNSYV
jgi:hypothetical protein